MNKADPPTTDPPTVELPMAELPASGLYELRVGVEKAAETHTSLREVELHAVHLTRASQLKASLTSLTESTIEIASVREISTSVRFYIHAREDRPSLGLDDLDWFHMRQRRPSN